MANNKLKKLERKVYDLGGGKNSEKKRLKMRKVITKIHGMLEKAETAKKYCKIDKVFYASRGLLEMKYNDYVILKFISSPKE